MSGPFLRKPLMLTVAVLLVLPSTLAAAKKLCPMPGPVTPESYTWNFKGEVNDILAQIEREAAYIKLNAEQLITMARVPMAYSVYSHSTELTLARERINRIGDKLCRLQEVQRVVEPWQQERVKALKARLTDLANDTEAAIEVLNQQNLMDLHQPVYKEYLAGMYRDADALCHCSEAEWAER